LIFGLFFLLVGSIILYWQLRKSLWRKAEIVEDHGDRLVVTRYRTTIEVPLSQVQEVLKIRASVGTEVVVVLKAPCLFGSEISFYPPSKRRVPDIEDALDKLTRRVSAQHSKCD